MTTRTATPLHERLRRLIPEDVLKKVPEQMKPPAWRDPAPSWAQGGDGIRYVPGARGRIKAKTHALADAKGKPVPSTVWLKLGEEGDIVGLGPDFVVFRRANGDAYQVYRYAVEPIGTVKWAAHADWNETTFRTQVPLSSIWMIGPWANPIRPERVEYQLQHGQQGPVELILRTSYEAAKTDYIHSEDPLTYEWNEDGEQVFTPYEPHVEGPTFVVSDGHHRVRAAQMRGDKVIDAVVRVPSPPHWLKPDAKRKYVEEQDAALAQLGVQRQASRREAMAGSLMGRDTQRVERLVRDWQKHHHDLRDTPYWQRRFDAVEDVLAKTRPTRPVQLFRSEPTNEPDQYRTRFTAWSPSYDDVHGFGWGDRRTVSAIFRPEHVVIDIGRFPGLDRRDLGVGEVIVRPGEYKIVPWKPGDEKPVRPDAPVQGTESELRERLFTTFQEVFSVRPEKLDHLRSTIDAMSAQELANTLEMVQEKRSKRAMLSRSAEDMAPVETFEWRGLPVCIEAAGGDTRHADERYPQHLPEGWVGMGYIKDVPTFDGDSLDVIIGGAVDESGAIKDDEIYIATQTSPEGDFTQFKVMFGFESEAAAQAGFLLLWPRKMFSDIVTVPRDYFLDTLVERFTVEAQIKFDPQEEKVQDELKQLPESFKQVARDLFAAALQLNAVLGQIYGMLTASGKSPSNSSLTATIARLSDGTTGVHLGVVPVVNRFEQTIRETPVDPSVFDLVEQAKKIERQLFAMSHIQLLRSFLRQEESERGVYRVSVNLDLDGTMTFALFGGVYNISTYVGPSLPSDELWNEITSVVSDAHAAVSQRATEFSDKEYKMSNLETIYELEFKWIQLHKVVEKEGLSGLSDAAVRAYYDYTRRLDVAVWNELRLIRDTLQKWVDARQNRDDIEQNFWTIFADHIADAKRLSNERYLQLLKDLASTFNVPALQSRLSQNDYPATWDVVKDVSDAVPEQQLMNYSPEGDSDADAMIFRFKNELNRFSQSERVLTYEGVKGMLSKIRSVLFDWKATSLVEKIRAFHEALTTAHNNGTMSDWVYGNTRGNEDITRVLTQLSNMGTPPAWGAEVERLLSQPRGAQRTAMPLPAGLPEGWQLQWHEDARRNWLGGKGRLEAKVLDEDGFEVAVARAMQTADKNVWQLVWVKTHQGGWGSYAVSEIMSKLSARGAFLQSDTSVSESHEKFWQKSFDDASLERREVGPRSVYRNWLDKDAPDDAGKQKITNAPWLDYAYRRRGQSEQTTPPSVMTIYVGRDEPNLTAKSFGVSPTPFGEMLIGDLFYADAAIKSPFVYELLWTGRLYEGEFTQRGVGEWRFVLDGVVYQTYEGSSSWPAYYERELAAHDFVSQSAPRDSTELLVRLTEARESGEVDPLLLDALEERVRSAPVDEVFEVIDLDQIADVLRLAGYDGAVLPRTDTVAVGVWNLGDLDVANVFDTNSRQAALPELALATALLSSPMEDRKVHRPVVMEVAQEVGVDPALLDALVWEESKYNHDATSSEGARGLLQLTPSSWKSLDAAEPQNVREHVSVGARYLKKLIDLFKGDLELALAAYNAGPRKVREAGGVPEYTRAFVDRVLARAQRYRKRGEHHEAGPVDKLKQFLQSDRINFRDNWAAVRQWAYDTDDETWPRILSRVSIAPEDFENFQGDEFAPDFDTLCDQIEQRMTAAEKRSFAAWMVKDDPGSAPSWATLKKPEYILGDTWLVHFSPYASSIVEQGFTRGVPKPDNIAFTKDVPTEQLDKGGYTFAYTVADAEKHILSYADRDSFVMFFAPGVKAYHTSDRDSQVIVWGPDVPTQNMVLVEYDYAVIDRGGRKGLRGQWEVRARSGTSNREVLFSSPHIDKIFDWVETNFAQYRRQLTASLWENIHKKRERGERPAKPGEDDYPDEKTWKKLTAAEWDEDYGQQNAYARDFEVRRVPLSQLASPFMNPVSDARVEELAELTDAGYELPPVVVNGPDEVEETDYPHEKYPFLDGHEPVVGEEVWWLHDGHHRATLALQRGEKFIDAAIIGTTRSS